MKLSKVLSKRELQIDFGEAKEVMIIANTHDQYLWIGRGESPLTCYGTITHKAQIKKLRKWCDDILKSKERTKKK